jgi:hypothetical protein
MRFIIIPLRALRVLGGSACNHEGRQGTQRTCASLLFPFARFVPLAVQPSMTSLQQATTKVTKGHKGHALHFIPFRALRVLGGEVFLQWTQCLLTDCAISRKRSTLFIRWFQTTDCARSIALSFESIVPVAGEFVSGGANTQQSDINDQTAAIVMS